MLKDDDLQFLLIIQMPDNVFLLEFVVKCPCVKLFLNSHIFSCNIT